MKSSNQAENNRKTADVKFNKTPAMNLIKKSTMKKRVVIVEES